MEEFARLAASLEGCFSGNAEAARQLNNEADQFDGSSWRGLAPVRSHPWHAPEQLVAPPPSSQAFSEGNSSGSGVMAKTLEATSSIDGGAMPRSPTMHAKKIAPWRLGADEQAVEAPAVKVSKLPPVPPPPHRDKAPPPPPLPHRPAQQQDHQDAAKQEGSSRSDGKWRPRGGKNRGWYTVFHAAVKSGATEQAAALAANTAHPQQMRKSIEHY